MVARGVRTSLIDGGSVAHESAFNEGPVKVRVKEIGRNYMKPDTRPCPNAWGYRSAKGGVEIHVQVENGFGGMAHYRLMLAGKRAKK